MPNLPPRHSLSPARPAATSADPLWLCRLADIPDEGATGTLPQDGDDRVIAVRSGGEVRAYHNHCPHQGAFLELRKNHFMAPDGRALMCHSHGARFQLHDGYCFSGPCRGQSLPVLPIQIVDGDVRLTRPLPWDDR